MGEIKLMTKQTEEEFVSMVVGFAQKNGMTISNVKEGMNRVVKYLEDNASLDARTGKDIGKSQKNGQEGGYQKDVFPEVEINYCAVLELPDIFKGSYISAHRLHELGILTYSQQAEMARMGIL